MHAEHPRVGELGARSIIPEGALKAVSASARRSAPRGLQAVQAAMAAKAGHEAAAVAQFPSRVKSSEYEVSPLNETLKMSALLLTNRIASRQHGARLVLFGRLSHL